jgi:SAM-dependent methyltransferase
MPTPSQRFDAAYYRRHYLDPKTRAATRHSIARQARILIAMLENAYFPVHRILDAGCGLGWYRAPLARAYPLAEYVGLDVSEELCRRRGWAQGSIATFRSDDPFDLVICSDVVQYLDDRAAAKALGNLGRLSTFFQVLTQEDFETVADPERTDLEVHLRPADWYRTRLRKNFRHLGCGVHIKKDVDFPLWELERPWA